MSGHPRGIYWKDLNEVQRTTAQSVLGLDEASWDAGAPPPVVEVDPDSHTAPPPVSIKLMFPSLNNAPPVINGSSGLMLLWL